MFLILTGFGVASLLLLVVALCYAAADPNKNKEKMNFEDAQRLRESAYSRMDLKHGEIVKPKDGEEYHLPYYGISNED